MGILGHMRQEEEHVLRIAEEDTESARGSARGKGPLVPRCSLLTEDNRLEERANGSRLAREPGKGHGQVVGIHSVKLLSASEQRTATGSTTSNARIPGEEDTGFRCTDHGHTARVEALRRADNQEAAAHNRSLAAGVAGIQRRNSLVTTCRLESEDILGGER